MYERVLDESRVACDIVDSLRATTDAPLSACIEAARNVLATMAQFVTDDVFAKIDFAVQSYAVDLEDCYDSRLLGQVGDGLEQLFREKEELSYSASQDDVTLIEYLRIYSDCTSKTDPRIPFLLISKSDFMWLGKLVNLYQMDQNDNVRVAVLHCLQVLCDKCDNILDFLLESILPAVLASQIPSRVPTLTPIELDSLKLMTKIYSSSTPPPLDHYDIFNADLFEKLLHIMELHPEEVLSFLINFNYVIPEEVDNPVVMALLRSPRAMFGQVFIDQLNKSCTVKSLHLLINICSEGLSLLDDIFYSNDLEVLGRVLCRELINSEDQQVRTKCLEGIACLAKLGIHNSSTREAVSSCNLNEDVIREVLAVLE